MDGDVRRRDAGGTPRAIADLEDAAEIERRRDIASEWEHLADRIPVVRAALNEYEWAIERDARSA
ncbi:hypothetical protein GCM10009060_27030 [Halorubrum trapanicum]